MTPIDWERYSQSHFAPMWGSFRQIAEFLQARDEVLPTVEVGHPGDKYVPYFYIIGVKKYRLWVNEEDRKVLLTQETGDDFRDLEVARGSVPDQWLISWGGMIVRNEMVVYDPDPRKDEHLRLNCGCGCISRRPLLIDGTVVYPGLIVVTKTEVGRTHRGSGRGDFSEFIPRILDYARKHMGVPSP